MLKNIKSTGFTSAAAGLDMWKRQGIGKEKGSTVNIDISFHKRTNDYDRL